MQINLTITVKNIKVENLNTLDAFKDARVKAYEELMQQAPEWLGSIGYYNWFKFADYARVAREVDGTYTVTIP